MSPAHEGLGGGDGGVGYANLDKINIDRYRTLGDLQADYNVSDEFGRTQIWRRGYVRCLSAPNDSISTVWSAGTALGKAWP